MNNAGKMLFHEVSATFGKGSPVLHLISDLLVVKCYVGVFARLPSSLPLQLSALTRRVCEMARVWVIEIWQ